MFVKTVWCPQEVQSHKLGVQYLFMSRELLILSSFTHQLNSKVTVSFVLKYISILFSVFPLLSSVPFWHYFPLPLSIFLLVFFDDLLVVHVVFVWKCVYFSVASVF